MSAGWPAWTCHCSEHTPFEICPVLPIKVYVRKLFSSQKHISFFLIDVLYYINYTRGTLLDVPLWWQNYRAVKRSYFPMSVVCGIHKAQSFSCYIWQFRSFILMVCSQSYSISGPECGGKRWKNLFHMLEFISIEFGYFPQSELSL